MTIAERLRQQGGAMIVTIPRDLATDPGWSPGTEITVEKKAIALICAPQSTSRVGVLPSRNC